ncbi:MAG: threonylcarbamoyl-AMP synthase [Ruminococcaceae bacterium]|nr:threonylcarbamoyl-AMP synthase [Oscillospiraceae bacterium]
MNTLLLGTTKDDIKKAASIIKDGGVVAMPTETVYGLAADALNGECVKKIFLAKRRPMDNPLIVHISDISDIERFDLVSEFPLEAQILAQTFWPGPLTIIMKKSDRIPDEVSAGLPTVAIRLPSHSVARQLIKESGTVLAAPSANRSGSPSPTTATHVMNDLCSFIDAVVDGGACDVGVESTVVTLATTPPRLLRPGLVTVEQIEAVIGKIDVDDAVLFKLENGEKAASPGMKYKHYSPKAKVVLINSDGDKFISFVNSEFETDSTVCAICYDEDVAELKAQAISIGKSDDLETQAKRLFDALRKVDTIDGVKKVYAHCPTKQGVGMALYNRLIRAASFEVIEIE